MTQNTWKQLRNFTPLTRVKEILKLFKIKFYSILYFREGGVRQEFPCTDTFLFSRCVFESHTLFVNHHQHFTRHNNKPTRCHGNKCPWTLRNIQMVPDVTSAFSSLFNLSARVDLSLRETPSNLCVKHASLTPNVYACVCVCVIILWRKILTRIKNETNFVVY